MTVQEAIRAVVDIIVESVGEAGPMGVGSGVVYAAVMPVLTLEAYESLVSALVDTGRLTRSGHVLRVVS